MSLLVVLLPAIFLSQQVGLFNTDISQLNPASIASKKVDANLRQALGAEEIDHIFLASDKNLAKVLTKTQEIQQQLKNLVTQDIIGGTMGN
jgi:predicted exporter